MAFIDKAKKFNNKPIVIVTISWDSGDVHFCAHDAEVPGLSFVEGRVLHYGTIRRSISNTSGQFQISDVSLELSNIDNYFSSLNQAKILNREVQYRVGFHDDTDIADYKTAFKGVISNFEYSNEIFVLSITDRTQLILEKTFGNTIKQEDWPNVPSKNIGKKMQIIYGNNFSEI